MANPQIDKLREQFDARPAAEKFIVAVLLAGILFWLYLILISDPLKAEINEAKVQLSSTEARLAAMQTRQQRAEVSSQQDPNRAAREQLAKLVSDEAEARAQLNALTGSVISPLAMNSLLTSVLETQSGLSLKRVENLPPQQVTGNGAAPASGQRVFQHGLVMEFEGDFLSTLKYLVYLESLSENFYWDALSVVPSDWPTAKVKLELHTLSAEENFIGV